MDAESLLSGPASTCMPFLSKEPKRPLDKASAEDITCHDEDAKGLRLRTIGKRIADSRMPWELFFGIQSLKRTAAIQRAGTHLPVTPVPYASCCLDVPPPSSVDWRWEGIPGIGVQ